MINSALAPQPTTFEKDVHLLLADDSKSTLELLQFKTGTIEGWRATTVTTASGIIAELNKCSLDANCHYDAIITDINFFNHQTGPRMTGITAIRQVRKAIPSIPVIFATAYVNVLTKEAVNSVGGLLVPKPFDIDSLFERLNSLIKAQRDSDICHDYVQPITASQPVINILTEVRESICQNKVTGK